MDSDKIVTVKNYLVTETVIDANTRVADLDAFLKGRKTTGKLQFDMSQGGHQRFLLTERTKLTEAQSLQLRSILGWNGNA